MLCMGQVLPFFLFVSLVVALPSDIWAQNALQKYKSDFSSRLLYSSPTQIVLDAATEDGLIYVPTNQPQVEASIKKQLRYLIGQLGWYRSMAQFSWSRIEILDRKSIDREWSLVRYRLSVRIAWDRQAPVPESLEVILPPRGDDKGLHDFYVRYGFACRDRENPNEAEFFYDFAPLQPQCPFGKTEPAGAESFVQFRLKLQPNAQNTNDKYPEYDKIWADRKLSVAMIFSKNRSGTTENTDSGIASYNATYRGLLKMFGKPLSQNVNFTGDPGIRFPSLEMYFTTKCTLLRRWAYF
jgi:hypothetical protein